MAASATVFPPYWSEQDNRQTAEYQSISSHPLVQNFSFEELRLEDYNVGCKAQEPILEPHESSNLMATRQLFAPSTNQTLKPIRAVADRTQKLNGDVIIFLVGTDAPRRFAIHEGMIEPRSEFVRLALRGEWKEAQERTIPLPEDDPKVFSVYQQWLYGGLIHTRYDNARSKTDDEYEILVKAYILGEKIMDQDFKDSIANAIVEKLRLLRRFDTSLTSLVFDNTPSASPLRLLWLDAYYCFGSPEWLDAESVGSPINTEFMVEFSRHQMQHRTAALTFGPYAMFQSCTYHEHGTRPCHRQ